MKAVCQRVSKVRIIVSGKVVSVIEHGMIVFLGIHKNDDEQNARKMARKISKLRIFDDQKGKMNLSLDDVKGDIMLVSQFTLYGDATKGNRPSFVDAAAPDQARVLYDMVHDLLTETHHVETGVFQAHMSIESFNDGPVTMILET